MEPEPRKFTKGELERLVDAGLSIRRIAVALEVSPVTVRKWLKRFGLETERSARTRMGRAARASGRRVVLLCGNCHAEVEAEGVGYA